MSQRSNANSKPVKKTAKQPIRKVKATHATARRPVKASGIYVGVAAGEVVIADRKPPANGARGPFANFEHAKSAALDALLEIIDHAESRLSAIKRARSLSDLQPPQIARPRNKARAAQR